LLTAINQAAGKCLPSIKESKIHWSRS